MDEYQEYLRMFGDLPFGMRPKFEDYQKQRGAQTARNTFSSELQKGNLDTAYKEGYEKLPIMDQLLYGVAPVTGEALATYEIPEFAKRGNVAAQEGRKLDAAGNYLVSGLNAMSMIPVVGKGAGLLGDAARLLGKGTRAAKPLDDMGGGGGRGIGDNNPPADKPTAKPMRFDVEERGEEMYFEQYNRGLNHQSPVADTLDTFSDEYVWNQEEMYKKLRSTRPAVTTLEKAIEEMPGFDSPDKKYSMQEMLNLARKHGIEGSRKNTYNQNVLSQIEEFTKTLAETSPNKVANLSEKMTKQELLDLINKNSPRFSETRTTVSGKFDNEFYSRDMPAELAYSVHSPFVPKYDAPRSLQEAQKEESQT
jgi:hypothetical protein